MAKTTKQKTRQSRSQTTPKRRRLTISFQGERDRQVFVAGDFNQWDPTKKPMKEVSPGEYQAVLMLPAGVFEYKFVVDGEWVADPSAETWSSNPYGSLNSVIKVEV